MLRCILLPIHPLWVIVPLDFVIDAGVLLVDTQQTLVQV
jgi:hypothetical protein